MSRSSRHSNTILHPHAGISAAAARHHRGSGVSAAAARLDRLNAAVRFLAIATRTLLAVMAALVLISKVTG